MIPTHRDHRASAPPRGSLTQFGGTHVRAQLLKPVVGKHCRVDGNHISSNSDLEKEVQLKSRKHLERREGPATRAGMLTSSALLKTSGAASWYNKDLLRKNHSKNEPESNPNIVHVILRTDFPTSQRTSTKRPNLSPTKEESQQNENLVDKSPTSPSDEDADEALPTPSYNENSAFNQCVDWAHTDSIRVDRHAHHIRRLSRLDVSIQEEEGASLGTKRQRAMRLLRVMTRMYGDGNPSSHAMRFDDREKFPFVGYAGLDATSSTLSTLKKVFYNQTKNKHILVGEDIVLVCYDVVSHSEAQVVTTTFVKYLLNRYVNGRQTRQRKTLEGILSDFELGISADRIDSAEAIYALVGLSKIAQCKENQRELSWDRHVKDSILIAILSVLQHREPDLITSHNDSIQFQALITLWSLASTSYVLCARFGTLPIVSVLVRYMGILRFYKKEIEALDLNEHVEGVLGALASASSDGQTQAQLWPDVAPELLWAVDEFPSSRIQEFVFQIVRNGSIALRNFLDTSHPANEEIVLQLLISMLKICKQATKARPVDKHGVTTIDHMLAVLANCNMVLPRIPIEHLGVVFQCSQFRFPKELLNAETETHLVRCLLVVLAKLTSNHNDAQRISCEALVEMYARPTYIYERSSLQNLALEVLIDTLACVDSSHLESHLVQSISQLMLATLQAYKQENPDAVHAVAYNLARLRFTKCQKILCIDLLDGGVIDVLLASFASCGKANSKLGLQIMSALVTLANFATRIGGETRRELWEKTEGIMSVLQTFENETPGREWLRNSHIISNGATLAWSIRNKKLASRMFLELLQTISAAYFSKDKPVWGLVNGAICQSLIDAACEEAELASSSISEKEKEKSPDLFSEAPQVNVTNSIYISFARHLCSQLKQCANLVRYLPSSSEASVDCEVSNHPSQFQSGSFPQRFTVSQQNSVTKGRSSLAGRTMSRCYPDRSSPVPMPDNIPPAPFGANEILTRTERLIESFKIDIFEDEDDNIRRLLDETHRKESESKAQMKSRLAASRLQLDEEEIRAQIEQCKQESSTKVVLQQESNSVTTLLIERISVLLYIVEYFIIKVPARTAAEIIPILQDNALGPIHSLIDSGEVPSAQKLACCKVMQRLSENYETFGLHRVNVAEDDTKLEAVESIPSASKNWVSQKLRLVHLAGSLLCANKDRNIQLEAAELALQILASIRPQLSGVNQLTSELASSKLHIGLLELLRYTHLAGSSCYNKQQRAAVLGCILLLSENHGLQLRLARHDLTIETLFQIANIRSAAVCSPSWQDTNAELAIKTLLNLKENQGNLTAFYMVELRIPELRTKLKVWLDEKQSSMLGLKQGSNAIKRAGGLDTRQSQNSTPQAVVEKFLLEGNDAPELLLGVDAGLVFPEPIISRSYLEWVIPRGGSVSLLTVSQLKSDAEISEDDLLPAPRDKPAIDRLFSRAAMLRGEIRQPRAPRIWNYLPSHNLNPHAFLCPETGLVLEIPLEFVLTRDSQVMPSAIGGDSTQTNLNSTMRFLQASSMNIAIEDDDEWDLVDSVFGPRAQPALDAGHFWNTEDILQAAMNWDLSMCMRKPSFVRTISSRYSKADLVTAISYIEASYTCIGISFLFYTSTERVDARVLSESTYNMFCLSRNQYWQFLEDSNLLEIGSHLSVQDFDEIYARVTGDLAPATSQEIDVSQVSAVFKHGKRSAPMCRYQFVELIFLLADAIYVHAPSNAPQRVRMLCRAVLSLVDHCFKQVAEVASLNSDLFRHNSLYRVSIHNVFQRSSRALKEHVFNRYAGESLNSTAWGGARGLRMSLPDWNNLIDQLELLRFHGLSNADCNIVFQLSILTVVDLVQDWQKACSLTFVSFLEALARLALYLPLPTRSELAAHGVTSIAAYYDMYHATDMWQLFDDQLGHQHNALHDWLMNYGGKYASRRRRSSAMQAPKLLLLSEVAQNNGLNNSKMKLPQRQDISSEPEDPFPGFADIGLLQNETSTTAAIEPEQAQAVIDLFLAVDFFKSKRAMRELCWFSRLTPLHESQESFDICVAYALHENDILGQNKVRVADGLRAEGKEVREPLLRLWGNQEVDIANTPFAKLPMLCKRDYFVSAHIICNSIRKDLEDSKWGDHLETINMVPLPDVKLRAHQLEGITLKLPIDSKYSRKTMFTRLMINEADAMSMKRLSSRRFEEYACRQLYRAWKLRNPLAANAQVGMQFDDLSTEDKSSYIKIVHIAVLLYIDHLANYWMHRSG